MIDYFIKRVKRGNANDIRKCCGVIQLIVLLMVFCLVNSCKPSLLKHPSHLSFKPLEFPFPQAEQVKLSNGIELYLLEDNELPLINLVALVRTGSVFEPADKAGLAALTGTVMRTGGTSSLSGDEINEKLEFIAGSVETGIGREVGSASLSVLKKDINLGLTIFADVLRAPAFSPDKVELAKQKKLEGIRRQNDNPQSIAFREFRRALFDDGPRGRVPTVETVSRIAREDMIAFHKQYFYPNNIIMGVSGDFKRDEIVQKLETLFKSWEPGTLNFPGLALPAERQAKSVYYAQKDLPQSTIIMGNFTADKTHPDYFPFTVLNYVIGGGGFTSRLMSEIRSNRGLAYSVGSIYRAETDYGLFATYCFTKSESTLESINLISGILEKVKNEGITQEELDLAKSSLLNSFIFEFTTPFQIVNKQVAIAFDNLPKDFLEIYRERLTEVTLEDVNTVAQRYIHPDRMLLVVVGNSDNFDGPLNQWGPVEEITLKEIL
jgi:predicted Zn-dependent peptidase